MFMLRIYDITGREVPWESWNCAKGVQLSWTEPVRIHSRLQPNDRIQHPRRTKQHTGSRSCSYGWQSITFPALAGHHFGAIEGFWIGQIWSKIGQIPLLHQMRGKTPTTIFWASTMAPKSSNDQNMNIFWAGQVHQPWFWVDGSDYVEFCGIRHQQLQPSAPFGRYHPPTTSIQPPECFRYSK